MSLGPIVACITSGGERGEVAGDDDFFGFAHLVLLVIVGLSSFGSSSFFCS